MPVKNQQRAEINNFVQGLITEASPLNFPQNASADEENFELNRDGTRQRRLGMGFEVNNQFRLVDTPTPDIPSSGLSTFKWEEVSGNPEIELVVSQVGNSLYFFDAGADSISNTGYRGSLVIGAFPSNVVFSMTSIEGLLLLVAGTDYYALVEFIGGSFVLSYDRLRIRDVFGVQEVDPLYETDYSYRGALDNYHYYNLQNQSWGIPRTWGPALDSAIGDRSLIDPVLGYVDYYGKAPGNGEQVWPGLQFQAVQTGDTPYERIWFNLYDDVMGTDVQPARGYYIIDALRRGASRQEQVGLNNYKYPQLFTSKPDIQPPIYRSNQLDLRPDNTQGGASCVAEYAGRAFYSGFEGTVIDGDDRSPNYSNYVFFSQLVKSRSDLPKCYQEGDPTSRETPDIVDTDGGFLRISEAVGIIGLINLGSLLVVLAKNGVWSITGGSDYGFSAANYKVNKLSTYGVIARNSIVLEGETAFFWSYDGIYGIARNQYGDWEVKSITLNTVQKLYQSITPYAKETSLGVYDSLSKQVRWVYRSGAPFAGGTEIKELVFDMNLGAFYQNRIGSISSRIAIVGAFESSSVFSNELQDSVISDGQDVVVNNEIVTSTSGVRIAKDVAIRYMFLLQVGDTSFLSVSTYNDVNFRDWFGVDGVGEDAKAFCLTGFQTANDVAVDKQITYLTAIMKRTETNVDTNYNPLGESSCLARCQWAFANGIQSNRWTRPFQLYRHRRVFFPDGPGGSLDNGLDLVITKNKVRGRGESFAFYFETEPYKDCHIIGWNITLSGNSKS